MRPHKLERHRRIPFDTPLWALATVVGIILLALWSRKFPENYVSRKIEIVPRKTKTKQCSLLQLSNRSNSLPKLSDFIRNQQTLCPGVKFNGCLPTKDQLRAAAPCSLKRKVESGDPLSNVPSRINPNLCTLSQGGAPTAGAELGVQEGTFAKYVLSNCAFTKYYLIDAWRPLENYHDIANSQLPEETFQRAKDAMRSFGNTPIFLRNLTIEAADLIPDDSLDFIYIDARHSYEDVLEDMTLYWPKLRSGGLFAGHDFMNSGEQPIGQDWALNADGTVSDQVPCERPADFPLPDNTFYARRRDCRKAVKAAVQEFAAVVGVKTIHFTTKDKGWPSWYFLK